MESSKRIILAVVLSALILIGFNVFMPQNGHRPVSPSSAPVPVAATQPAPAPSPQQVVAAEEADDHVEHRLKVSGPDIQGSFNLRGARLDELELTRYRETIAKDSPLVRLLQPAGSKAPSYLVLGWDNAAGFTTRLPNEHSLWQVENGQEALTPEHPATLYWDNGAGVRFIIHLQQDSHYMVTVRQEVENHSGQPVSVYPFQRVQRDYLPQDTGSFTAYEGPIAVMNGRLADNGYKALRTEGSGPDNVSWQAVGKGGWGGITDKYWLTAIGADAGAVVRARYSYEPGGAGSYRVTFTPQEPQVIQDGARLGQGSYLFAGAKNPELLREYGRKLGLPRFDDSIDFGWFSFLTKPILFLLHWLYVHIGNFGLGLMVMTLLVKIVLFPLASKAAQSSARMRMIAPKVTEIREKFKDDPMAMNQKVMALYKEEKINPAGGCLPMLIQAPIFFCLYKMLNLSIDERHAPFFGWIHDLSVPDPTNLFNLFGLLPFDPTHILSFLHLSVWGAALGITFWLLQKHSMVSMDPAQARIMQFMPVVYVFVMSSFPAGLLVYYTWNNVLTFLQQRYIERRTDLPVPVPARTGKAPPKKAPRGKGR